MRLRLTVPTENSVILTSSAEFPSPSFAIAYRRLAATIELIGGSIFEVKAQPIESRWCRGVTSLRLEVTDTSQNEELAKALTRRDKGKVVSFLGELINHIVRTLRAFGHTHSLPEVNLFSAEPDYFLLRWNLERLDEDGSWKKVFEREGASGDVFQFLASIPQERSAISLLPIGRFQVIQEAFDERLEPAPYLDFYLNALDHIQRGNRRLSVVEAVISLEIASTAYIRECLGAFGGLEKSAVDLLLQPQVGLAARIVFLRASRPLQFVPKDISRILKVVKWRNDIMHKKGRLPDSLPQDFEQYVSDVLAAARVLGDRAVDAQRQETLRGLKNCVKDLPGVDVYGRRLDSHQIALTCELELDLPLKRDLLEEISNRLIAWLSERDSLFVPATHLTITFERGGSGKYFAPSEPVGVWEKGALSFRSDEDGRR